MTDTLTAPVAGSELQGRLRGRRPSRRRTSRFGPIVVTPYLLLMIVFGILPAVYAIYLSVTDGDGAFAPVANFATVIGDFRCSSCCWPSRFTRSGSAG